MDANKAEFCAVHVDKLAVDEMKMVNIVVNYSVINDSCSLLCHAIHII